MSRRTFTALAGAVVAMAMFATPTTAKMDEATEAALKQAMAGQHRTPANAARDAARHPLETLKFMGLNKNMKVMEVWPSGGYWTEILAPVLKDNYIAAHWDPARSENTKKMVDAFKANLAANEAIYGKPQVVVLMPQTNQMTPVPAGSVDMVVTFRNIHNWMANDQQDAMFKVFYDALKPGGYLGVKEHRGDPSKPQDPKAASGYVREDVAQAMAEKAGFKLVAKSDINNNPKDTKDYPKGVWTLPPNYREGDVDKAKYTAIGESDRFTHLYQKPAM
ncbi:MAG: methyltransferase domain-containing protein [Rhodospirillaceae bacterium]|nr:methyltransferase domain-containing protein [Rhodospirillaceae bacterium]